MYILDMLGVHYCHQLEGSGTGMEFSTEITLNQHQQQKLISLHINKPV